MITKQIAAGLSLGILILFALLPVSAFAAEKTPVPKEHSNRNIEGWTVRVDNRLLKGEHAARGERAIKLLQSRLVAIAFVVPEKSLAKLRTITIELDLNYGDLVPMQYHPDAGWLKKNGYSEKLARCVHIPDVADFLDPEGIHGQPWVVLHELAHGFHDQAIGFDEPRVTAAWKKFRASGKYKSMGHRGLALTESVERFFQKILHGVSSGLALPSVESRAVVGDFEKKPHAWASSQP